MDRAVKLAKGTGLQARDVSKKEMAKLQRLRKMAAERDLVDDTAVREEISQGAVKLSPVIAAANVQ